MSVIVPRQEYARDVREGKPDFEKQIERVQMAAAKNTS